jgi:hypothetical protein
MYRAIRTLAVAIAVVASVAVATAQETAPRDAGDEYTIDLPAGWEQESFVDGAKIRRVEYIFGDRSKGLLKVKRVRAERGQTFDDVVSHDVDGSLKFQPGFVMGRNERFAGGAHTGALVQYDFTRGGKPMLGRHYYLAGAEGTVWVLQFTGDRTTLGQIRNVTDQMARSFKEK